MRTAFVILYSGNKRRLASDVSRSVSTERMSFEDLKRRGLPKGVDRAEYHDSDLRGSFLTFGGVDRQAAHAKKVEKIAAAAEKRRQEQATAVTAKAPKPAKPAATAPKKPAAGVDRQAAHAKKVEKIAAAAEKRRQEQAAAAKAPKTKKKK